MNNQKLLILSVLAALLMIGGAIAFVKLRNPSVNVNGAPQSDHVVVDEIMSSCKPDEQCIVVDTKCSFCCSYVAINAKSETLFNQMFDQTCKTYSGSYCDCHDLESYPSCVNGKCQMVKWNGTKTPAPAAAAPVTTTSPVTPAPIPAEALPEPVQAPVTAPVQPPVQTLPPAIDMPPVVTSPLPEASPDPFGESEVAPEPEQVESTDDLYAPLPEDYQPTLNSEEDGVHVIEP